MKTLDLISHETILQLEEVGNSIISSYEQSLNEKLNMSELQINAGCSGCGGTQIQCRTTNEPLFKKSINELQINAGCSGCGGTQIQCRTTNEPLFRQN